MGNRPYAGFTATCEIRFHAQFKVNFIACIEKNADLLEHFDNKQKLSLEKFFSTFSYLFVHVIFNVVVSYRYTLDVRKLFKVYARFKIS